MGLSIELALPPDSSCVGLASQSPGNTKAEILSAFGQLCGSGLDCPPADWTGVSGVDITGTGPNPDVGTSQNPRKPKTATPISIDVDAANPPLMMPLLLVLSATQTNELPPLPMLETSETATARLCGNTGDSQVAQTAPLATKTGQACLSDLPANNARLTAAPVVMMQDQNSLPQPQAVPATSCNGDTLSQDGSRVAAPTQSSLETQGFFPERSTQFPASPKTQSTEVASSDGVGVVSPAEVIDQSIKDLLGQHDSSNLSPPYAEPSAARVVLGMGSSRATAVKDVRQHIEADCTSSSSVQPQSDPRILNLTHLDSTAAIENTPSPDANKIQKTLDVTKVGPAPAQGQTEQIESKSAPRHQSAEPTNAATAFSKYSLTLAFPGESPRHSPTPDRERWPSEPNLRASESSASSSFFDPIVNSAASQRGSDSSSDSGSGRSSDNANSRKNATAKTAGAEIENNVPASGTPVVLDVPPSLSSALSSISNPHDNSGTASLTSYDNQLKSSRTGDGESSPHLDVKPELPLPSLGPVQVARMMERPTHSEMRIGLSTAAFGSVEVRTVIRANDVGVLIGSEKGDLHSIIATELPGIANALRRENLHLADITFLQPGLSAANDFTSGGNSQSRSYDSKPHTRFDAAHEPIPTGPLVSGDSFVTGRNGLSVLA
jgi:hypothetical protein